MPFVILPTNSISGGYDITNSLRFNSGSSDYLNRTPASAGNRKTFTFSAWVKRSNLGANKRIFTAGNNGTEIIFNSSDNLVWYYFSGSYVGQYNAGSGSTSSVFRDVSAWYHIVLAVDTTQSTGSNRVKIYINGIEQTRTINEIAQNTDVDYNNTSAHYVGKKSDSNSDYFDGYMSEINFIDGQALTPSSFGETDFDTGIWKPKAYTGTYGTNGFYLQFKNSASLGTDSSGNGNTFTVNNLTSIDQTTDTPTNNFCTLNPLDAMKSNGAVLSEGNLKSLGSTTSGIGAVTGTISVSQGKWYWEVSRVGTGNYAYIGVGEAGIGNQTNITSYGISGYRSNGDTFDPDLSILTSWDTAGDIIMIAMDMDNGAIYYGKNGTWLNSGVPTSGSSRTGALSTFTPSTTACAPLAGGFGTSNGVNCNFGNPPYSANSYTDGAGYGNFSYSVPSGFYALCTKNLATFG